MCSHDECPDMTINACNLGTSARSGNTAGTGESCDDCTDRAYESSKTFKVLELTLANSPAFTKGILTGDKAPVEGESLASERTCITVAMCTRRLISHACSLVGCESSLDVE